MGWRSVLDAQKTERFNAELVREVAPGHLLHGENSAQVLGRFEFSDDFLYLLPDGRVAQVHLTWTAETAPDWPWTTLYPSFFDWAAERRTKATARKHTA